MKLEIALLDETELANAIEDGDRTSETKPELKRRNAVQHRQNNNHDALCCCIECL